MPYSIRTKDGIVINNIPDDIPADSPILKERVAALRAGQEVTTDDGTGVSPGVVAPTEPEPVGGAAILEPLAAIGSSIIAEPIAGLAGIVQAVNPFAEEGAGARAVEATREALTFKPRTEEGKRVLGEIGGLLEPVGTAIGEAEKTLGDATLEATGSPALAAAAATIPTAIIEILGVASGKGAIKAAGGAKKRLAQGRIAREISDAVPTIDQLKDTARAVYAEIDDAGAVVKASAIKALTKKMVAETKAAGLDPRITPKAAQVLDRFTEVADEAITVTELDTLRKVAQNAAKSTEPAEAALGVRMIESVDEFLDNAGPNALVLPKGAAAKSIGKKYRVARDLWGRARRAELLEDAFESARLQASGFENGIRVKFRQILNNKRQRKFFKKHELDAMTRVVKGTTKENLAKLIGRFGFSEGSATNALTAIAGAGAGAAIGGPVGAVLVPTVGQISRKLAQRMTVKGAEFADQVIRAGKDAKKIAAAYKRNTPKALRSSEELSELLMRPDIDLATLPADELAAQARQITIQRRAELAGALAAGAQAPEETEQ